VIWALAVWQSMNSFRWLGVSVINTASILSYTYVRFRLFTMSWNTYFLNYLCQTWPHKWHLVDASIALFSLSLTLANDCGFILSKLWNVLLGFPRLGAVLESKTADECTHSKLNDMRHAWYVVSHCRPHDHGGIKGWLLFPSHRVIQRSIMCHNS